MNKLKLWILDKLGGQPKRPISRITYKTISMRPQRFGAQLIAHKEASRASVSRLLAERIGIAMLEHGYIVIEVDKKSDAPEGNLLTYTAKACAAMPGGESDE